MLNELLLLDLYGCVEGLHQNLFSLEELSCGRDALLEIVETNAGSDWVGVRGEEAALAHEEVGRGAALVDAKDSYLMLVLASAHNNQ